MAAAHILEKQDERYRVVIHRAVPAGNNAAGFTWKSVLLAAGLNTTVMTEGTAPGQISTAEKASVLAGDTLEVVLVLAIFSGGSSVAQINTLIDGKYASWLSLMQAKYNWWGATQT